MPLWFWLAVAAALFLPAFLFGLGLCRSAQFGDRIYDRARGDVPDWDWPERPRDDDRTAA